MSIIRGAESNSSLPDLSACEREPIHTPGMIEPNGAMLVLGEHTLIVLQASSNTMPILGVAPETLPGMRLSDLFLPEEVRQLVAGNRASGKRHYVAGLQAANGNVVDALIHWNEGLLIVEFEPAFLPASTAAAPDTYTSLTEALGELDGRQPLADLCQGVAARIRAITGFDRVMVYRFLSDDTGSVIAEDKRPDMGAYLGLRYPASDIPAQARRLYLLNTLRLKADVNAPGASLIPSINPLTRAPVDMTFCVLRAMSLVHVEYLRNMGVAASMSISIVKDQKLWGLIACHHNEARIVPHRTRITCEVLARVFSSHIAMAEAEDGRVHVTALHALTKRLEERMRKDRDVVAALSDVADNLAAGMGANGCAFIIRGEVVLAGVTPSGAQVQALADWLNLNQREHLFETSRLAAAYSHAPEFKTQASGLLSLRIALGSPDFVLWFRPPVIQTITWAGNPDKPVEKPDGGGRISPRRSFASWNQTYHDSSEPWTEADRTFASSLRPVIAETLFLQMNEEVLRLNLELGRSNAELSSFAYSASHDLQEPVRTMRIYAQMVAQRAGPDMDPQSRAFVAMIEDSAERMSGLIGALLSYSQLGGVERRRPKSVNLEEVLDGVLANLDGNIREHGASITHDELPVVFNDGDHMAQVFQNLIGNAIKYRGEHPPRIQITNRLEEHSWVFCVNDNGLGFDPAHASMIFEPFKRLHGREIPGNGIGLATCKRIVEIYKGRIWAESSGKGKGATFCFTLPSANTRYKSVQTI